VAALVTPGRDAGFLVFSQAGDARIDIDAWDAHAARFFATRIGLTEDRHYPSASAVPLGDAVRFVIAPHGRPPAIRSAFARPREDEDLALAEAADARSGFTGLALLARRCPTVWLVEREGATDRMALRLSAVLASVLLGPILESRTGELFGVKTARAKITESLD
jgi:hypothetical protein